MLVQTETEGIGVLGCSFWSDTPFAGGCTHGGHALAGVSEYALSWSQDETTGKYGSEQGGGGGFFSREAPRS